MDEVVKLLIALLFIIGIGVFAATTMVKEMRRPCLSYKTVTDIQGVPLANFWGMRIRYIYKFDDGSVDAFEFPDYKTGEKVCAAK